MQSNLELYHHGILGQKWGVRRFQNRDGTLTVEGKARIASDSRKREIVNNPDGSKTVPKGFSFNRVGKSSMDVNQSGALYVSYGKEDAARYIKSLGPTPLNKLFGTSGDTIQHISVKESLRMPSDEQTAIETAKVLMSDNNLFNSFKNSFYSLTVINDFDKNISDIDIKNALKDPNGKAGQTLAYGVSSFLGDPNYSDEARTVYEHFRSKGFDAIPDVHDRLSGTSQTAMIVINPSKVEIASTTAITKDVMTSAKKYVKTLEKLKVSNLIG